MQLFFQVVTLLSTRPLWEVFPYDFFSYALQGRLFFKNIPFTLQKYS